MHPFDDPVVIAGQGPSGSRSSRTCPTSTSSSSRRRRRPRLGDRDRGRAAPAGVRVVAVEPERSNALAAGLAAGEPVPVTPRDDRGCADGAVRRRSPIEICGALGVEVVLVSEDEIEGGVPVFSTAARSSPPSRPAPPPTAAVLAGKVGGAATRSSPSSPEATSAPISPLLSWLDHED